MARSVPEAAVAAHRIKRVAGLRGRKMWAGIAATDPARRGRAFGLVVFDPYRIGGLGRRVRDLAGAIAVVGSRIVDSKIRSLAGQGGDLRGTLHRHMILRQA